ncbi:MAG TPA: hypothetical protein VEC99_04600, partial [Clostridia bacterium]|nr:hypothetical protein [Clostridia bacterium]
MKKHYLYVTLVLCSLWNSIATEWYAAPNASINGNGSFTNPWPLHVALTKVAVIQPGDVLNLRGGIYRGPCFVSTLSGTPNNYVTVRSYPGEWAVITDGSGWVLRTDLPSSTQGVRFNNVVFEGSEDWPNTSKWLKLGEEYIYVYAKSPPNKWSVDRGQNAVAHASGEMSYLVGTFLIHKGSYVRFMEFEITATSRTNRVIPIGVSSIDQRNGINFPSNGRGNKAINLIIHNVGHPAIGFWNQGDGGEINGCLLWGNGIYDNDGAWPRGNGVYAQNQEGTVILKNNIVFRNFTFGIKGYGESGPVNGFRFLDNIAFASPNGAPLEISAREASMTNNMLSSNYVLGSVVLGYVSTSNI